MLDTLLQPSAATRLLHLLQAAQPFLTPNWSRLADLCIRFLSICDLFLTPREHSISHLLHDIRGCAPSNNMNALLCAIRPFCSEDELRMLQMYEQFQQMQKMMDMWKIFSDLMPNTECGDGTSDAASPFSNLAGLLRSVNNENGFDNIISDFMNSQATSCTTAAHPAPATQDANPLLAFLSPEQLELYNSILAE